MGGFFNGMFGGGTKAEVPQLAADGQQQFVDNNDIEDAIGEMHAVADEPKSEVMVKRPPDFLDNIYPPIPARREFSATEVWQRSGVGEDEQENVERAQQLLGGLPHETPDVVKRQIVEAAFKAFEVSIEDIVAAASHQIHALRDYIADANERAERFKSVSEERIAELEAEIERIRGTIIDKDDEREQLIGSAMEVIEDVEPVLHFFGDEGGVTSPGVGGANAIPAVSQGAVAVSKRPASFAPKDVAASKPPASFPPKVDASDHDLAPPDAFGDSDTTVAASPQRDEDVQDLDDAVEQIS